MTDGDTQRRSYRYLERKRGREIEGQCDRKRVTENQKIHREREKEGHRDG